MGWEGAAGPLSGGTAAFPRRPAQTGRLRGAMANKSLLQAYFPRFAKFLNYELLPAGLVFAYIKLGPASSPSCGRASQFSNRASNVKPALLNTRAEPMFSGQHVAQIRNICGCANAQSTIVLAASVANPRPQN